MNIPEPSGGKPIWLLVEESTPGSRRVEITTEWPKSAAVDCERNRSISPLFSSTPDAPGSTELAEKDHLAFFFHPDAYLALSSLSKKQRSGLWFSQGLASIVAIGLGKKRIDELRAQWIADLRGVEVWTIRDGKIENLEHWLKNCDEVKPNLSFLVLPEGLDRDTLNLARQIDFTLRNLVKRASQYAPEILDDLSRFVKDIQSVLEEIAFLEAPPSVSVIKTEADKLKDSASDRIAELNHRIDLLVQFNSSLSYVISQGFHGCIPILDHTSLVADHSLLGVGTAWRALSRFAHYVNVVLDAHPMTDVVRYDYKGRAAVSLDDESVWFSATNLDPDTHLAERQANSGLPKLAFFSSRLGFGETNYNVTAAAQALHAADTPRRSLMTLSHEMMHAHVTGLLAAIFCSDGTSRRTIHNFEDLLRQWKESVQRAEPGPCFLSHLRFWILDNRMQAYELSALGERSDGGYPETGGGRVINRPSPGNPTELQYFWRESYRFLNEIIVHTLDFHYFYNEATEIYLDSIWESWITVPGVVDEPLEYLLRSLVTIASAIDGNVHTALAEAKRQLEICLARLIAKNESKDFLQMALDQLRDEKTTNWLSHNFPVHFSLAKVVRKFLRSDEIQTLLSANDDENLKTPKSESEDADESEPEDIYDLETCSFSGVQVNNPIAFLRDRLWRSAAPESLVFSEEYRTAWVFIVLASSKCEIYES